MGRIALNYRDFPQTGLVDESGEEGFGRMDDGYRQRKKLKKFFHKVPTF